jgi:hypothetical protein
LNVPPAVLEIDGAVCFRSGMEIDADGGPHAYAPPQLSALFGVHGLDYLANAGKPGNWYGLVCVNGEPVVQGPEDPAPGYFVSPTALADHSKAETNPARYVNAEVVPYISVPPDLKARGVQLGDLCVVGYRDGWCPAIVADIGPHGKYGEGSIALANVLGLASSPRNGGTDRGVTYVIFPGTSKGWPRDFAEDAATLLAGWGGPTKILSVPL